jgi:hypothetical protein
MGKMKKNQNACQSRHFALCNNLRRGPSFENALVPPPFFLLCHIVQCHGSSALHLGTGAPLFGLQGFMLCLAARAYRALHTKCPALGKGKVPLGNVPSRYMRKFSANTFIPTKHWCIPLYNRCESFYSFNKCEISYKIEAHLKHCMSNSRKNIL